jgi:anti-sigma28 factor (negative regulator of flagellin synthesis)
MQRRAGCTGNLWRNTMSISNVGSNQPVQQVTANPPARPAAATTPGAQTPESDQLQLSGASHLHYLNALKANDGVRNDKVTSIKSQIENGAYEDDTKLNGAIDKLLDELNK